MFREAISGISSPRSQFRFWYTFRPSLRLESANLASKSGIDLFGAIQAAKHYMDTIHIWTEWPNGDKFPFGPAYQPFGRFAITTLTHLRHPVHSHLLGPSLFSANSLCPFLPCTPTFDHQSPAVGSCISLPLRGQESHLHGHAVVKVQRSKTASFPLILPDALCERRFRANGSHPDDAGDIDLAMQVLVAPVVVQAVLECLANRDHHRYCSTYVLTEQAEQHTHHVAPYIPNLKDWALRGFL
jgi:hypothetical protein